MRSSVSSSRLHEQGRKVVRVTAVRPLDRDDLINNLEQRSPSASEVAIVARGQDGRQSMPQHWYPVQPTMIVGLEQVKQIDVNLLQQGDSAVNLFACALHTGGTVSCWGGAFHRLDLALSASRVQ